MYFVVRKEGSNDKFGLLQALWKFNSTTLLFNANQRDGTPSRCSLTIWKVTLYDF